MRDAPRNDEMTESELGHWHRRAVEAEALIRKDFIETTSIHNDMLALAELVGVHYDGVSSPAGFLHGDIMPAIQRLEESRVIAEHLYQLTRAEKQALARRNNDLKLALHTAQQDLQRLASPTRCYGGTDWESDHEHRSRLQFATAANVTAMAALRAAPSPSEESGE